MFSRVLVANRGEIAVRVIRALHELGIEAVAVYSTADADAMHVRLADRAVRIGPPPASESYLSIPSIVAAATTTGCEAVHPGYGFLSENDEFVHACEDNDLVFIGPPADVMARMGDKTQAKAEMRAAGVPLVPGTDGAAASVADARAAAAELGFPVLLKAAAGGGGRGMRLVTSDAELEDAYARASSEAEAAFSDGTLYVEKVISPARHVEIQVLCDSFGGVLTCGERECSIQRRHQKLIEESPSPALDAALREEMEAAAERACLHIGYRNAGTFEFLVGPDGSFSFIELNARLQVEHPVTEMVTSLDLVREQIRIAAGERLALTGRAPRAGHAIEIRINAEDPSRGFAPAPGILGRFRPPLGPGVRVDTFVEDGASIPPHYDSLMAKVVVWDDTRDAAIARALRALGELEVRGIPTTREAALEIIASDEFRSGEYSTSFLEEAGARLPALSGAAK
jgi:acetyl-CoA carboxylase biotin carboxylase subunit